MAACSTRCMAWLAGRGIPGLTPRPAPPCVCAGGGGGGGGARAVALGPPRVCLGRHPEVRAACGGGRGGPDLLPHGGSEGQVRGGATCMAGGSTLGQAAAGKGSAGLRWVAHRVRAVLLLAWVPRPACLPACQPGSLPTCRRLHLPVPSPRACAGGSWTWLIGVSPTPPWRRCSSASPAMRASGWAHLPDGWGCAGPLSIACRPSVRRGGWSVAAAAVDRWR